MRLLREPLVHFLLLGAALFLLFAMVGDSDGAPTDRIVISNGRIEQLTEIFMRTWQRPPTEEELAGLIENHIRDEVYYREALAMGLDRDDTIVRRRLRQKLEFLTDDLVTAVDPTPEELETYFDEYADAFRLPARVSFQQIYFNPDRRGEQTVADAESLLARLAAADSVVDPAALGDPLLLPGDLTLASEAEVAQRFGRDFAVAVAELPVGRWSGPVESGFGQHLVLIGQRQPGSLPPLVEVRESVEREWRNARHEEATETFYGRLRERYDISIEYPATLEGDEGPKLAEVRR
jgi:hypothetical protein